VAVGPHWFGQGERREHGLASTMKQPYGRIVVMHLSVLGSSFLLAGTSALHGPAGVGSGGGLDGPGGLGATPSVLPGVLLIALDVGFHVRAHRWTAAAPSPAMAPTSAA
jgi:hypothetical protein